MAHLVRHPDRLVHGNQSNSPDRNCRHPLIDPFLLSLLDPPQQRCSPQPHPRLPTVHQSRPLLVLPPSKSPPPPPQKAP